MARAQDRVNSALSKHGYTQLRKVGEGSFGAAILCQDSSDKDKDSKAIVKMIDISRATKAEKDDALKESRVLSQLRHPYIVRCRENFLEDGWLCVAMDFCEGGNLSHRIQRMRSQRKSFPENQVLRWFTEGILALQYIHHMKILHRDLKSGNFFLSKSGNMKMGDFGCHSHRSPLGCNPTPMAKVLECTAAYAQTQIGTTHYLSPEIYSGMPYSFGCNIWSMGCILYEMCARKLPFDAPDLRSLSRKITSSSAPDIPSEYSAGLKNLGRYLLIKNPDDRPSAADVLKRHVVQEVVRRMLDEVKADDKEKDEKPTGGRSACSIMEDVEEEQEVLEWEEHEDQDDDEVHAASTQALAKEASHAPDDAVQESTPHFKCPICLDEHRVDIGTELDCSHHLCHGCFHGYLESKICDAKVGDDELVCPMPDCGRAVTVLQVETAIFGTALWDKFLQFRLNMWEPGDDEVMCDCPIPGCDFRFLAARDMANVECPKCRTEFCLTCRKGVHDGMACDEFASMLRSSMDSEFERLMADEQWKRCPVCGMPSERVSGCNFMRCESVECRRGSNATFWCYICAQQLDEDEHYSHFPSGPYEDVCHACPEPPLSPPSPVTPPPPPPPPRVALGELPFQPFQRQQRAAGLPTQRLPDCQRHGRLCQRGPACPWRTG